MDHRIAQLTRRLFAVTKRPVWLAAHAITGKRPQAVTQFFDFGMYGGFFEAESKEAGRRLPPGFEIVEQRPGITEVELWCAEYRRMDLLQPYNELGVFLPVRFVQNGKAPRAGSFVLQMPVTTEEARWGGVDIYGFPKFLAEITIDHEQARTLCAVRHRGVDVLTLQVDQRLAEPFQDSATLLNVRDDGHVIECTFEMSGARAIHSGAGAVTLELGHHAIADELRQIGLRPGTGRGLYLPRAHGALGKGSDLGALPARLVAASERTTAAQATSERPVVF